MSFSDLLKQKNLQANENININVDIYDAMVSVMTLAETGNEIAAYAGDDFTKSDKYLWYDEYYDDDYSTIDKQKNVVLSKNQINLTQEENSQVIPFMLDRYFDGMDLMKMLFQIHFVNANGDEATTTPVNVQYNFEKIKFYFLVPAEATAVEGILEFEILAIGTNEKGDTYRWRTKPNSNLNVLRSLSGNGIIEPTDGWDTYLELINQKVIQAQNAATDARNAATSAQNSATAVYEKIDSSKAEITNSVKESMVAELSLYYTQENADKLEKRVSDNETSIDNIYTELETFQSDPTAEWVAANDAKTDRKISEAITPVQEDLNAYKTQTNADLQSIHDNIDNLPSTLETDYYKKTTVDTLLGTKASQTDLDAVKATANSNKSNVDAISAKIVEIEEEMNKVNTDPTVHYRTTYDATTGQFVLNEITEDEEGNEVITPVSTHIIVGGSGGGATSSSLKIEYVTKTPLVVTINDRALITYKFSGEDSSGDAVLEGQAIWKIGGKIVATSTAVDGENTFDITDYIVLGTQKVLLSITDDSGSLVTKSWTVQKIDVRLESTFNDSLTYPIGDISFDYTPYGSVPKDIHFVLDGKEIGVVDTNVSGIPMSFTIPTQEHGAHLMDAYITAVLNNNTVESNHIVKDIIWYDHTSTVPVIGCVQQEFTTRQYDTTNIVATVFDPSTETPTVVIAVDGTIVSTQTLTSSTLNYPFKSSDVGEHIITLTCGETVKTLIATVEKLDIEIAPVTAGLAFDFNPHGKSNSDDDRLWSYNDIAMTVSDNFDWINGGYQLDENGDQYFCIKAGTTAIINYNLFADDPKKSGKEFKVIFRTANIRNRNTSFLSCKSGGIGLDMKVEDAKVYFSDGRLEFLYCENEIIEYEFNINKNTDLPMVMSYEDGTPAIPVIYSETSSFRQTSPVPITIGSADCDVYIYRMKAYTTALTDTNIKDNFIADARNAEEMLNRYYRNQIYTDNILVSTSAIGEPSIDALIKAAPDLRYIFVEAPYFTNDKSNKIDDTTIRMIYKNGRPEDNWICTGARHSGQGTSSNKYGYSARNLDLIMDRDTSLFKWTNADGEEVESKTITLTETSVPTDYLNVKVNVASSENTNNAQMARRFNEYQPFLRYARKKDSKVKDTMEFYNCVVFIRETNTDIFTHREFQDTNWHFYSIGNVGDSKKTDDTRVNNKRDPKECVVEIMDADKALSAFPTGKQGNAVCPVEEWIPGNTAYDALYSEYVYETDDKTGEQEFKSFGTESYEFRYEMKDITEEQRQTNIDTWREFYKFVVTSTDEEFYTNLKKYFVVDSALYYYLFTERYTMVDNRAKNSFWHYGKVYISSEEATALGEAEASCYIIDDEQAAFADGYRWDLTFGYDMDTSLGIDNTGKLVFSYGKEDVDYYVDGDPSSDYVFRVADSTFFCKIRDLFNAELITMFKSREDKQAWSATGLINQWDTAQAQFPEELWRLNFQRLYYRTYLGISIDNSFPGVADTTFLVDRFFGRKKYQRRMFEGNQEVYFATKYFGNTATQDDIFLRGNVPLGSSIKQNYTLRITPYSNMYIGVQFGSTSAPINVRAKAGIEYVFENDAERMDFISIYGASYIQAIGDLSRCYIGDNNFSKAIRLQRLVIGSTEQGYNNTFMTELKVASNKLLEYLDLRNISGLNTVINVSGCGNLKELYAEGTNASGVVFANGGMLETAHLPKITSLSMKNLNNIKDFMVDGYDNLETLIVEYCPSINTYDIVNDAPKLNIVRLIGIDWNKDYHIEDGKILDRLLSLYGVDSSGYETDVAVLAGKYHSAIIRSKNLEVYTKTWKDLDITFDSLIEQYPVTFVNYDGTVLEVQYVDKGENAVDPTKRTDSPMAIPKKPSSVSHDFTFDGWDSPLNAVFTERTITAVYTESLRSYTVKYVAKGITMQETKALYGDTVFYTGNDPIYTAEEPAYTYHLFSRWDKSGFVDGDKTVNALFDRCEYTDGYFNGKELSDLKPVEIYAMTKLGLETSVLQDMDTVSFSVGMDYEYDDIESHLLIADKTSFNGSQHIDTEIKLFDEDRDFVLAIDYEFLEGTEANSVLAQCFQSNGNNGFKLWYNGGNKITWGTASNNVGGINYREMLIIRHCKGENNLWVYNSNLNENEPIMIELTRSKNTIADSTLVFGATKADDGLFENYAIGNIHWCKLWYTDLGDDVCKKLAGWTHEKISFHVCGFKRYYLSDNPSKRCSFSLLASHLLERDRRLSNTQSNSDGWASMQLNTLLNKRLYNAMPTQWKALIKKVTISSSVGSKSTEISTSECYITIPSCIEVDSTMTTEPYVNEGSAISYMTTNTMRKRAYDGGDYHAYWLRSPNIAYTNYMYQVDEEGNLYGYHYPNYSSGVLIEVSI